MLVYLLDLRRNSVGVLSKKVQNPKGFFNHHQVNILPPSKFLLDGGGLIFLVDVLGKVYVKHMRFGKGVSHLGV